MLIPDKIMRRDRPMTIPQSSVPYSIPFFHRENSRAQTNPAARGTKMALAPMIETDKLVMDGTVVLGLVNRETLYGAELLGGEDVGMDEEVLAMGDRD